MNKPLLEYSISARRIGGHEGEALCKNARIAIDIDPARQAPIGAGLPVKVPAMTVNRVCGSGAQAIASACLRELGLAEDVVNVDGGAIARGHPIGASGAVLTTRLLHSMKRDGLKRGVVTPCIGGGQGIALALEVTP